METGRSGHVIPFSHVVESFGVDWLTATARRTERWREVYQSGLSVLDEEIDGGNDLKAWTWQNYEGYRSGGASVGLRSDGAIVQLRSETARTHWKAIVPISSNVSRLDLQITARLNEPHPSIIRGEFVRLKRLKQSGGRPSERTLIDSRLRGSSLYVGRRASDKYARMYDKGAEENCAPIGTLIRWEVEYKKRVANHYATQLSTTERYAENVIGTISSHFRSRGIRCVRPHDQLLETPPALRRSDATGRFEYLRTVVAPMLDKLRAYYEIDELLSALNLYNDVYGSKINYKRKGG